MIISDLLDSNANALFVDLQMRIYKLEEVLLSAAPKGDFAETIRAQILITKAAFAASNAQYKTFIQEPVAPPPVTLQHGQGVVTWREKLDEATTVAGRELTCMEMFELARNHVMTEQEIKDQKESFARQDMD